MPNKTNGAGDGSMSGASVLIVEDSEDFSAFLRELLIASGYNVLPVLSSGEDALRTAGLSRPDIVLIDVGIGGSLDGIESGGRIMENFGIPVIFLSGYTDEVALERAKTKKPSGYLVKPFNKAELRAAIEIALYRHRAEAGEPDASPKPSGPNGAAADCAPDAKELKELKAEVLRLRTENSGYRKIIDSLNRSLNRTQGNEEIIFLINEGSAPPENKSAPAIEFENE